MKNSSALKLLTMAFLLLSCTAISAGASMFELEIVPLSKLVEEPSVYDSTMAYRKISVVGNMSEVDKRYATITEGEHFLKIDMTKKELFEGFDLNDQLMVTGEFTYDPIGDDTLHPNYVLHYPIEDAGIVNISTINNDIAAYNGKYVTVIGNISSMQMTMGRQTIVIEELDTEKQMKVYYYGATDLEAENEVKVVGLYNGKILHSETMGKNRPPISISTIIPGFSSFMGVSIIGLLAILLRQIQRND
ncbi:hypothetical protein V7O66_10025 [Methanolobus sp. ZRKC3]|uniref:hypothetical protein n=1 Tax=Methanolobus sp. ZRKC3 TaxID=3125786 RepID=UPI00324D2CB5